MKWVREPFSVVGIGLSLLGLVLVLLGVAYIKPEPWNVIVTHLGSVMIGAGVVEFVTHYYTSHRLIERAVEQILGALKFPIAAFYENRNALVPLAEELADAGEFWVAWHVGTVAHTQEIFSGRQEVKARIILTHPESAQLHELEKVVGKSAEALSSDIREFTKSLKQKGNAAVKWLDGPVCNSLIIANPGKPEAWARVEVLVPGQVAGNRPSFRVEKAKNKELFEVFFESYKAMWGSANRPSL